MLKRYNVDGRRIGRIKGKLEDIEALLDTYTEPRNETPGNRELVFAMDAVTDALVYIDKALDLINNKKEG